MKTGIGYPGCLTNPVFPSACPESRYGKDCAQFCACGKGQCDPRTGKCTCAPGHTGPACQQGNRAGPRSPRQWVTRFRHPADNTQCQTLFTATFPRAFADNAALWGARPLSLPAPSPSLILPTPPCHPQCQGAAFSRKLRRYVRTECLGETDNNHGVVSHHARETPVTWDSRGEHVFVFIPCHLHPFLGVLIFGFFQTLLILCSVSPGTIWPQLPPDMYLSERWHL